MYFIVKCFRFWTLSVCENNMANIKFMLESGLSEMHVPYSKALTEVRSYLTSRSSTSYMPRTTSSFVRK